MNRFNFKIILSILGLLLTINGIAMLLPLPFAIYYGEEWQAIVYSALLSFLAGAPVWMILNRGTNRELKRRDVAVLFSSHLMHEVSRLCDQIIIVSSGIVVASGTTEEIRDIAGEENLEEAFVKLVEKVI